MEIVYTQLAVDDLRRIPKRYARQIVAKISRLEHGVHGNITVLFDVEGQRIIGRSRRGQVK